MQEAFLGIFISAMATGLGALPILFLNKISPRLKGTLLGYASGVMIAATTFSLIPEALHMSNLYVLSFGLLLGIFVLSMIDSKTANMNLKNSRITTNIDRKTLIVIVAVTLHNLPEGLSVGVSYGAGQEGLGLIIALAIGLQNAPEGFLIAIYLLNQNVSKVKALLIATMTGAVEIITGFAGYFLASYVQGIVSYGLSFAAGAMLFVIYKELIPDSQEEEEKFPTYAFAIGLISMLVLTQKFG
ncbi:dihydroorotate dehydrogenase [Mesobacillus campisalis]|uniref:Dihydroorotate dehydrogenase n=1 Tax=Mesobacillus campisalis TaxID=1408103 RepID=A0A0M2SSM7_9BACI|nr:ZIP family metal transporter [Mesobacillus campisalis]KKK37143.1 dihydroorotate dehydrogenase [Mesobacillus campisalis]